MAITWRLLLISSRISSMFSHAEVVEKIKYTFSEQHKTQNKNLNIVVLYKTENNHYQNPELSTQSAHS
jgi:hypothetical protein